MKSILFCIHNFAVGGVPRALLSLLPYLTERGYKITIFCPNQQGPYKGEFVDYNVLQQDKLLQLISLDLHQSPLSINKFISVLVKTIRHFLLLVNLDIYKCRLFSIAKNMSADYFDIVVAYSEGDMTEMVSRIITQKRIAWVHIDYKRLQAYTNGKDENAIYSCFDTIVSPSTFSAKSFCEVYPNLSRKVISIPNLLDVEYIRRMSEINDVLDSRFDTSSFIIISVGRICSEKQFYKIPRIVNSIPKHINFKWYIIGSGSITEEAAITNQIKTFNVSNKVILLGAKQNPYPYVRRSNILVSLSISETFSYAIFEARVLGIPVIATPFGSSDEVMADGAGLLAPTENLSVLIGRLIENKSYYFSLKREAESFRYNPNLKQYEELFS